MNKLLVLASAVGDRINPVAVKEFRQAVQSRLVILILMLFLMISLSVVGGYLLLTPEADTNTQGGLYVLHWLLGVLLLTCIGFVPTYTGVRMALERNDADVDLLYSTTITPETIVRGKYLSAMGLTLLIYSACMPFITLTYLLRGIELPSIFFALAVGFCICAAANAIGIFAGSVQGTWFTRGVVAMGMAAALAFVLQFGWQQVGGLVIVGIGERMKDWQFWIGIGSLLAIEIMVIGLLHVMSVAMLSPKLSNRMLFPRLYIMACWLFSGITIGLWDWLTMSPATGLASTAVVMVNSLMTLWIIGGGGLITLAVIGTMGERETWSVRVRRTIPNNRLLRSFAFLLYTGSAGGVLWCVLMFAATMLVGYAWGRYVNHRGGAELAEVRRLTGAVFGYVLSYCLTVAFLRTVILRRLPTRNLSVMVAFLGVAVYLVPYLADFFITGKDFMDVLPWYLLGSPLVLTTQNEDARELALMIMRCWLAIAALLSVPWLFGQWRCFQPYFSLRPVVARRQNDPFEHSNAVRGRE